MMGTDVPIELSAARGIRMVYCLFDISTAVMSEMVSASHGAVLAKLSTYGGLSSRFCHSSRWVINGICKWPGSDMTSP